MYNLFEDYDFFDADTAQFLIERYLKQIVDFNSDFAPDPSLLEISVAGYDSTNVLGNTRFYGDRSGDFHIEISISKYSKPESFGGFSFSFESSNDEGASAGQKDENVASSESV
jgi:hypothetical protein